MRKLLVAAMTAGLLAVGGSAMADVAGTGEGTSTNPNNNQVDCDRSSTAQRAKVPGSGITVAANGNQSAPQNGGAIVVCNDAATNNGAPAPIQGRIILSGGTGGGYVAADGDANNPPEAQGWARADIGSSPQIRCGGAEGGGYNAENPGAGASQANCG